MSPEGLWTFYNSKNPAQEIQIMGLASARVFARLLRLEELTVWKVKEQNNKSVKECVELFGANPPTSAPIPASAQVPTVATALTALSVVPKAEPKETRRHHRQNAKLSVAICKGKNVFRTYTKNISPGGLAVEGKVPQEFCVDVCKIIIDSGDNLLRIEAAARILQSNDKVTRLSFEGDLAHKLYDRLTEFLKAQENIQKKRTIKIS